MNRIRIGPYDYAIIESESPKGPNGNDIDGMIHNTIGAIIIRSDMAPQAKTQTLWHEIVHAIFYHNEIKQRGEAEINLIATAIMNVLRDNPSLEGNKIKWQRTKAPMTAISDIQNPKARRKTRRTPRR